MKRSLIIILLVVFGVAELSFGYDVPFKVLFNNDTTNVGSCTTPWGISETSANMPLLIDASVDESADAGVDAVMFSPGMGWAPWYPSTVYPDHYSWYLQKCSDLGLTPQINFIWQASFNGIDLFQPFVDSCQQNNVAAFLSYRLNDAHHLTIPQRPEVCKFYYDNPSYKIPGKTLHDWSIPAVRQYKIDLITEACQLYDINGLEIDFLRFPAYFDLDTTTFAQRSTIMTDFISTIRTMLDSTTAPGEKRYLCVRVHDNVSDLNALGIDLQAFVAAGVDMVNLSHYYWTFQQADIAAVRALIPNTPIYHEFTHQVESDHKRRATLEQLYTSAHLAYQRGADGISTFNFVYYRPHGGQPNPPYHEPPFEVMEKFKDQSFLAQQDQYYFHAGGLQTNSRQPDFVGEFAIGQEQTFSMQMAPTANHLLGNAPAILRFQIDPLGPLGSWQVKFNDQILQTSNQTGEPYPSPYTAGIGGASEYLAWEVPRNLIIDGVNLVKLKLLTADGPKNINWLEVSLPIPSSKATLPTPIHNDTGVELDPNMSWFAGVGATAHDIYLGTDPDEVDQADKSSPIFQHRQSSTDYEPNTLLPLTDYYWRIDEYDGQTITHGDVWKLTTTSDQPLASALLHLDADQPGPSPSTTWTALAGTDGTLAEIGTPGHMPTLQNEAGRGFYHFTFEPGGGGQIAGFDWNLLFDYDDDFTIEAWVRPQKSMDVGRMHIFGDQLANATGYRLTARESGTSGKFFVEFIMRDNTGTGQREATYRVDSPATFDMDQWHHIVGVYNGTPDQVPQMSIYCNGVAQTLNDNRDDWVPAEGYRDFAVPTFFFFYGSIGARGMPGGGNDVSRHWFEGDVGLIRVYDRLLSYSEIQDSYNETIESFLPPACWNYSCQPNGDANGDGFITSTDVSALVDAWNNGYESCADFSQDSFITSTDVDILINSWNAGGCP